MFDQNERNKWELVGGWFGNIANLAALLSLLFLTVLAVPKYAESADPIDGSILINEIKEYALRDVQDNRNSRPVFVAELFSAHTEKLNIAEISRIYTEEYTRLKGLSKKETMTTALWFVLWLILGISFICFMVLVWLGSSDKEGMSKGDLRKAIAVFLIVLFGSLVVSSYFPIGVNVPSEIQGIFAGAVATVIGFYFGSRASEPSASGAKLPVIPKLPVVPKPPVGPKPPGGPKPLDDPKPSGGK
jgi:hypothetical protein